MTKEDIDSTSVKSEESVSMITDDNLVTASGETDNEHTEQTLEHLGTVI